jgi:hypothetical protein
VIYNSFSNALTGSVCKTFDQAHGNETNFSLAANDKAKKEKRGVEISDLQAAEHIFPTVKLISYKKDSKGYIVKVKIDVVVGSTTLCGYYFFADPADENISVPSSC